MAVLEQHGDIDLEDVVDKIGRGKPIREQIRVGVNAGERQLNSFNEQAQAY